MIYKYKCIGIHKSTTTRLLSVCGFVAADLGGYAVDLFIELLNYDIPYKMDILYLYIVMNVIC